MVTLDELRKSLREAPAEPAEELKEVLPPLLDEVGKLGFVKVAEDMPDVLPELVLKLAQIANLEAFLRESPEVTSRLVELMIANLEEGALMISESPERAMEIIGDLMEGMRGVGIGNLIKLNERFMKAMPDLMQHMAPLLPRLIAMTAKIDVTRLMEQAPEVAGRIIEKVAMDLNAYIDSNPKIKYDLRDLDLCASLETGKMRFYSYMTKGEVIAGTGDPPVPAELRLKLLLTPSDIMQTFMMGGDVTEILNPWKMMVLGRVKIEGSLYQAMQLPLILTPHMESARR